jgi:KipI family sensor histidine kinase inhibitor
MMEILPYGENAVLVAFGESLSVETNTAVWNVHEAVRNSGMKGIVGLIPAYCSLVIHFDTDFLSFYSVRDFVRNLDISESAQFEARRIEVPVCYRGTHGLDLETLSEKLSLPIEEIIRLHSERNYRVFMLGFLPGFAFMGITHESLETKRHAKPRSKVPKGSVGLAGRQTGIYPSDSPGGWQIIGRTPINLFDLSKKNPSFFQPGDEVTFKPISLEQYDHLAKKHAANVC